MENVESKICLKIAHDPTQMADDDDDNHDDNNNNSSQIDDKNPIWVEVKHFILLGELSVCVKNCKQLVITT